MCIWEVWVIDGISYDAMLLYSQSKFCLRESIS